MIKVDPKKCSGCRLCEINCSMAHEGKFNPRKARIRVKRATDPEFNIKINICRQCKNAPCQRVCPMHAFKTNTYNGTEILEIDEQLCNACGACVKKCPFGAIFVHAASPIPLKCDLCHGFPVCTTYCPTKALTQVQIVKSRVS